MTQPQFDASKVGGIGRRAKELIQDGWTNDEIVAVLLAEFPWAESTSQSVNFYRRQLRRGEGLTTAALEASPYGGGRHGGERPGAGRPPGSPNKPKRDGPSVLSSEHVEEVVGHGKTPLEHFQEILDSDPPTRVEGESVYDFQLRLARWEKRKDQAAAAAAPYIHAKRAAVEHSGSIGTRHEEALDELS